MPFRFRRSTRLGPLRFNFAKSGLSSISVGGRGASYNIPVGRQGGARSTVGLPGTGMSLSTQEAQQNNGCGTGCLGLLALVALGFVLAFWQIFLIAAVLVAAISAVVYAALLYNQQQLKLVVQQAGRRLQHEPCMLQQRFGVIDSISVAGDLYAPRIEVLCCTVMPDAADGSAGVITASLSQPWQLSRLGTASGVAAWLQSAGITLLDQLSVEAKAVRAAMVCIKEQQWTTSALTKLDGLITSLEDTLAKSEGNELLESAIPQFQQALTAFATEQQKLQQSHHSATEMLRKLTDFLNVPASIRPILTFDLDQLFDPQHFAELEQSFSEVVALNDAFRQLSADALA
jgi:hypothetical protein